MVQKTKRGRGSIAYVREMMEKLGMTKPLLVAGRTLSPVFYEKALPQDACVHFGGYHANPAWEDCAAGCALYRENGCDGIISLGGGSAMDTAKSIKAMLIAQTEEQARNCDFTDARLPHIAIPATAGTGSEATQFAVMYFAGKKHTLTHPALLPDGVILDADLLDTLPEYHKKASALDALCQGIESYWANAANDDSHVQAYLAIIGVLDNLKKYIAGDKAAAEGMLEAAYRGGRAIQISRTTAAHAMSYGLAAATGIAHGHACALTLPYLCDQMVNNEDALPRLMNLAADMRLGSELVISRLLSGILIDLEMEAPDMPDDAALDALAATVNPTRLGNHPVPLTRDDLKRIYRCAFIRKKGPERQACIDIWKYYGSNA